MSNEHDVSLVCDACRYLSRQASIGEAAPPAAEEDSAAAAGASSDGDELSWLAGEGETLGSVEEEPVSTGSSSAGSSSGSGPGGGSASLAVAATGTLPAAAACKTAEASVAAASSSTDAFDAAWRRQMGKEGLAGALVALAYPDRIAQRQNRSNKRSAFVLNSGRTVRVFNEEDPLQVGWKVPNGN